ncbi:concanavalin A-like lectin/glucanase domain-containing protein [Cadophora sp. MPI-SDFR-AT-0126]|nr:concanavalin A-like lectin/glucanase domain-containing protein [Leotiomycetes sp. MPI-SDFR-AT-0126]
MSHRLSMEISSSPKVGSDTASVKSRAVSVRSRAVSTTSKRRTTASFFRFGTAPPSVIDSIPPRPQRRFKSARLIGEYEKPWKETPVKRRKWDYYIFWGGCTLGLVAGAFMCYLAWSGVPDNQYCLILEDDFKTINSDVWTHEIQRGGYGTGSFDWTTSDPKNSFTDAEGLHIVPTLTTESTDITPAQLLDNYVLNLTTSGECTSTDGGNSCSIRSNKTSGDIINPVRSARLTTRGKKTLTYGKVEVVAKMPVGDWLWPAIWMMPQDSVYGIWPQSGEIDIAESRGNSGADYPDGRDSIGSALHWGPIAQADAFWKTQGKHNIRRADYSQSFKTYGLEWSEKYLFTYIDSRLLQVFFINFQNKPNMWDRGSFGETIVNKSALHNPWSQTGNRNSPFDQAFYLILNVAVGGTNGYFKDGVDSKPWGDASYTAPLEFYDAQSLWLPTWGNETARGMTVKSVKMWSEGACK